MYQIHLILPYIGNSKVWRLNNLMVWKVFTVSHMYQMVPPSTRWPLSPANLAQNSPGNYQVVLGGIKFQVNYTNLWKTLAHLRVTPAAAVVSSVGHTLLDTGAFRIATLGITGFTHTKCTVSGWISAVSGCKAHIVDSCRPSWGTLWSQGADHRTGLQVGALFLAVMSSRSDTVPQVEAQFELKACTCCGDWILRAGSKVPTSISTLNNRQCDISSWGVRIHSQYCGMPISEDCNYQAKVVKIA